MMNVRSNGSDVSRASGGGIQWIVFSAQYLRRLRLITLAATAAMLVFATIEIAIVVFEAPGPVVPRLLLPLTLLLVAVVAQFLAVAALRRLTRRRLGVEGHEFLFDPGNGRVERYPFDTVVTGDSRQLLAGKRLIPLYAPLGPLFEGDKVQNYILARMAPSSRIGVASLFREALKRGSRDLWIMLVVVCLAASALLLLPVLN